MKPAYILAIDQGTTSSRAMLYDQHLEVVTKAQQEFNQLFPRDGWVEHCPKEIWDSVLATSQQALTNAKLAGKDIAAIGITNQRETTVVWHRETGEPIYNAIVWQDRRTHNSCEQLKLAGHESTVQGKTGLLLDPYFSATKIAWILDHVPKARALANAGALAFGTIDSWILWNLTGGKAHKTDASNAARTMLFNIHTQTWDKDLLALFDIPESLLPEVMNNVDDFGRTDPALFHGEIPITAMIGDQQAALVGQECFEPGDAKCTYGTGAFLMVNTGIQAHLSQHRMLTTVAYRLNGKTTYAMEGSIFIAGAVIQWLRDGLHFFERAEQSQRLVESLGHLSTITFVPAFTGLGAPYWEAEARGAIFGLTRDTGIQDITAAALQSVALQTYDLLAALEQDNILPKTLKVDGGMANNTWLMQLLADVLAIDIRVPENTESTVYGAAYFASSFFNKKTQKGSKEVLFTKKISADDRDTLIKNWEKGIRATLAYSCNIKS